MGGVRSEDLIQRIDDVTITDLDTYRKVMEKITKDQSKRVIFVVLRGVRTHFQYLEPDWKPIADVKKGESATAKTPATNKNTDKD